MILRFLNCDTTLRLQLRTYMRRILKLKTAITLIVKDTSKTITITGYTQIVEAKQHSDFVIRNKHNNFVIRKQHIYYTNNTIKYTKLMMNDLLIH